MLGHKLRPEVEVARVVEAYIAEGIDIDGSSYDQHPCQLRLRCLPRRGQPL